MLVRDYMTDEVFSIRHDKKLVAASEIMSWAHCRHVPVVDEMGGLVGVVSHRDLLQATTRDAPAVQQKMELSTITIKSVMHSDVTTVTSDATIQEAARMMRSGKIGCLPVVKGTQLVGIITAHDLLEIVEQMPAPTGAS